MLNPVTSDAGVVSAIVPSSTCGVPERSHASLTIAWSESLQDYIVLRSDRNFLKLAESSLDLIVGAMLGSLFARDQYQLVVETIRHSSVAESTNSGTVWLRRHNGTALQLRFELSPLMARRARDIEYLLLFEPIVSRFPLAAEAGEMGCIEPTKTESALFDAERRFAAAADASLDCLALLKSRRDASGKIVDFIIVNLNHCAKELLVRDCNTVIGMGLCELLPRVRADGYLAEFARVVETGLPFQRTVRNESPELRITWGQIQVVALGDGISITCRNVSHEKELEEELTQSRRLESIGRLAASVAHDFNNMLSVILSLDSMVHDALPRDSQEREDLAESLKATKRAGDLTRRLLAFSRQQVLAPAAVLPSELIFGLTTMVKVLAGSMVRVVIHVADELRPIWIDAAQLEQAIVNLVTNARDAMPNGGILRIDVASVNVGKGNEQASTRLPLGEYCEIQVSDNGGGIPPELMQRIFEPFFTTKSKHRGTGLGLASVLGFAQQSGGTVCIDSELGCGTKVRLLLPFVAQQPRQRRPANAVESPTPRADADAILLLERDPAVCRAMQRILEIRGYGVIAATSVEDAKRIVHQQGSTIRLLITDVVPPAVDAMAILDELLRSNPEAGVIYTSGHARDADRDTSYVDFGAVRLAKPVTPEALLSKVHEALAMSRKGDKA